MKRGGRQIDEGGFGKVYRPPLLCDGPDAPVYDENYVSKILDQEEAQTEFNNGRLVALLDRGGAWSAPAIETCSLAEQQTNDNYISGDYQLIYPYAGTALEELLVAEGEVFDEYYLENVADYDKLSVAGFERMVKELGRFLPIIVEFNKHYIHGDLHLRNLVFDGERIRMIDFATLKTGREVERLYLRKYESQYKAYGVSDEDMDRVLYDLEPVIKEEAASLDLGYLHRAIMKILKSSWGEATLKRRYKYWMTFHKDPRSYQKFVAAFTALAAA